MAKRIFLALLLMFIFPIQQIEAKYELKVAENESINVNTTMVVVADDIEGKVPAKEAHENSEKWVNIFLIVIFILAAVGLTAIGIVIFKSKK
ncbi:hypothetical protein [Pueribacillus sp. YX66]|uniref:hypothetical protein n=1 Tax=Pueribacillus sp. YX66 TaxID=3229242 RepID=UPI00358D4E48